MSRSKKTSSKAQSHRHEPAKVVHAPKRTEEQREADLRPTTIPPFRPSAPPAQSRPAAPPVVEAPVKPVVAAPAEPVHFDPVKAREANEAKRLNRNSDAVLQDARDRENKGRAMRENGIAPPKSGLSKLMAMFSNT